jgi:hypothetical protein
VGNHRLIALIHVPINVALVMIQNQYCPVFTAAPYPTLNLVTSLQTRYRFRAPVRVCASIDRILQDAQDRMIAGGLPTLFASVFRSPNNRQLNLLTI